MNPAAHQFLMRFILQLLSDFFFILLCNA